MRRHGPADRHRAVGEAEVGAPWSRLSAWCRYGILYHLPVRSPVKALTFCGMGLAPDRMPEQQLKVITWCPASRRGSTTLPR